MGVLPIWRENFLGGSAPKSAKICSSWIRAGFPSRPIWEMEVDSSPSVLKKPIKQHCSQEEEEKPHQTNPQI